MRKRLSPRLRFWLVIVVAYTLFFMFGGCADNLILFPQRGPVPVQGARRKHIPFQDGQLELLIARSPGATTRPVEAYVLTFVGNAARAEHTASMDAFDWRDKPVEVWTLNHPGYGDSTGPATLDRLAKAAIVAYDALAGESGHKPIILSGFSLGTTMALHVAAKRPAAGLILRNPPPLRSLILGKFGWWNLWLIATPVALGVPSELDSLTNAPTVKAPAIFLLSDADEVVPLKYQQKVVDAYAGEKRTLINKGGQHNDPLTDETHAAYQAATEWMWRTIRNDE